VLAMMAERNAATAHALAEIVGVQPMPLPVGMPRISE